MTRKRLALWLVVAWLTPPVVAGLLGWQGVWGGTSAFADYLIPIPVAGGVLHVPSLLVVTLLLVSAPTSGMVRWLRPLLMGTSLVAVLMLLDLEDLYISITTDVPGIDIDWRKNPVGLFILCDTLLAQLWLPRSERSGAMPWLVAAVLPLAYGATVISGNERLDRPFRFGTSLYGEQRGDQTLFVYTRLDPQGADFQSAAMDFAQAFAPEVDANVEDLAVYFTPSLEAARRGDLARVAVGLCLYEDGTDPLWLEGAGDCFSNHVSFSERLEHAWEAVPKGLPRDAHRLVARTRACEGVEVSETNGQRSADRECRGLDEERARLLSLYAGEEETLQALTDGAVSDKLE